MFQKLVGALVPLLFLGCTTAPAASTAAAPNYQLSLSGTIDGAPFEKVSVGSAAPAHTISISSSTPVNYFTVASCHRALQFTDIIPEKPWYGWSSDNRGFTWVYNEAPTIEDTGDCILRFCAFSKTVGSPPVACAVVDFKSTKYQLPGENICNGADGQTSGTAICHTQVGLLERYRFKAPVVIAPQVIDPAAKSAPYWIANQCVGKFIDDAHTLFEYQVPEKECSVIFMEKAAPFRRAKLTVIPYNQARYPGGN